MITTGEDPSGAGDAALLTELGELWDRRDPVPPGLLDRIGIDVQLRRIELELLRVLGEPECTGIPRIG